MALNINDLISSINKSGVAKASHFEVEILSPGLGLTSGPPEAGGIGIDDLAVERSILYRAETAELPGRSITTMDHRFNNYGPINKIPTGQVYSDVTVTILVSEDLREKEYFDIWHNRMLGTGAFLDYYNRTDGAVPWNLNYFDEYTGTVNIRQYGENGTLRSVHTLIDAYPIQMSPMQLNWNSTEALLLPVTFAYKHYRAVYEKQNQPGLGFGFGINVGPDGVSGSLRLPGLGNINVGRLGSKTIGQVTNRLFNIRNF